MIPIKDPAESVVIEFDFSKELSSIDSAEVEVYIHGDGIDRTVPSNLIDGTHVITGTSVYQRVSGGISGVDYRMKCIAVSGNDVIVVSDVMRVR